MCYCLMEKKVVFMTITSTKTYGPQKLVDLLFVKGSHRILVIGSYAVAVLKDDVVSHLPRRLSWIVSLLT